MSYILDALKKADAERERGAVPDLHAQAIPPAAAWAAVQPPRRVRPWPWLLGGAAIALAAVLGWHFIGNGAPAPAATPVTAPLPAPAAIAVPPTMPAGPSAPLPATAPEAPTAASDVAPAPTPTPKPAPAASPPSEKAEAEAPLAAPAEPRRPPPKAAPKPRPEAARAAPAKPARRNAEAAPAPVPAPVPAPAAAPASAPAAAPPAALPSPASAPAARVPLLSELPADARRGMPTLAIGGSVYSAQPASRMVIVNGLVVREGETVATDLVLVQVRPKSAVFAWRGQRFELPF